MFMSPKHYIPRIFTTIIVHSLLMRNDIDVYYRLRLVIDLVAIKRFQINNE
jgi:hypothetical protein